MKGRNWISKILLAWFILSFVTAAFFTGFLKAAGAEEVLNCAEPRDWGRVYDTRERWGGPDPTLAYRNGSNDIKVTHYGLTDSQFQTEEEYISWIKKVIGDPLFDLDDKGARGGEVREMTVAGKAAKWFQFQYEYEGFTDHHGAVIPHESVYEEFVIVPAEKGFWAVVLSNHRVGPFGSAPDRAPDEKTSKRELLLQTWKQFLESCRFVV